MRGEGGFRRTLLRVAVAVLVAAPSTGFANEALWALLRAGGQIVLIRHAETSPGVGDPPGFQLDDCRTQRNLNDDGRRQAEVLRRVMREQGVTFARVLSSPWCRCLDTARIAFGPPTKEPALANLFGRRDPDRAQIRALEAIVGEPHGTDNWVLVSHGATIQVLTGVSLATAEMLVLTPLGQGRFTIAGQIRVDRP